MNNAEHFVFMHHLSAACAAAGQGVPPEYIMGDAYDIMGYGGDAHVLTLKIQEMKRESIRRANLEIA